MKYRAVYRNEAGATFSASVEKVGEGWVMHTSDGLLPIDFHFTDDHAGPLTFDSFREEEPAADLRLHLPERIATESSFQQLQRAYVEQEIVAQRKHRQAARTEIQNALPDPAKVQAANDLNAQILRERRPHRGPAIIKGE